MPYFRKKKKTKSKKRQCGRKSSGVWNDELLDVPLLAETELP